MSSTSSSSLSQRLNIVVRMMTSFPQRCLSWMSPSHRRHCRRRRYDVDVVTTTRPGHCGRVNVVLTTSTYDVVVSISTPSSKRGRCFEVVDDHDACRGPRHRRVFVVSKSSSRHTTTDVMSLFIFIGVLNYLYSFILVMYSFILFIHLCIYLY